MNEAQDLLLPGRATSTSSEVAVIGMGCRLPGGIGTERALADFLLGSRSGIRQIPADRWSLEAFHDDDPHAIGKAVSRWAGFLDRPFDFDPGFFDIAPREALAMDPQQRLLLEVAYEALQDARLSMAAASRLRTGVFVGISSSDFGALERLQPGMTDAFGGTGNALSIAANRISHRFNLSGPSFVIDTACSSALVALDEACRNLASGTCDVALAGGVNCLLDPSIFVAFSKANMLSPTGEIRAFDAQADGFVRGEGCGLVVLKPLAAALANGDRIHATIRATAVRQDGRTPALTAPNGYAQEAMLMQAAEAAGIEPADVGYVEAHGTGTPVGDPIEAHAIGHVFGRSRRGGPLPVGSIKTNIGHLEPAAGIAGLIKAVLTVRDGIVFPNRNFARPNPAIPMDVLNITVPTTVQRSPEQGRRLAVVNSFGFGGTSACAIVQSPSRTGPRRQLRRSTGSDRPGFDGPLLVPLSAPSREGLAAWAGALSEMVRSDPDAGRPAALAAELSTRRDHFAERAVVVVDPADGRRAATDQFVAALDALADRRWQGHGDGETLLTGRTTQDRRLAFAFSGQGAQWWGMGRQLLRDEPQFRRAIEAFDSCFAPLSGWSAGDALAADEADSRIDRSEITQACLVAFHIALAALWRSRGLVPDMVLGHSLGEISAAHVAGAISLETVARLIHKRGLIPHHSPEPGAMAVVGLTPEELKPFLRRAELHVGAINGPAMTTLTGSRAALEDALAGIRERYPDAFMRRLNTDFAWHSHLLDHAEAWFREEVGELPWSEPAVPFVSTVVPSLQLQFDTDYWWENLRRPVLYRQGVELCLDLGIDAFLEIGPHRTLTPMNIAIAETRNVTAVAACSLRRDGDDRMSLARAAAMLHVGGVAMDWHKLNPAAADETIRLPLYPWRHAQYRHVSLETRHQLLDAPAHPLLGRPVFGPTPAWINEIGAAGIAYLRDHRIAGDCLVPAAAFVEIMLAVARTMAGDGPIELTSVRFLSALSLSQGSTQILRTELDPALRKIRIYCLERADEAAWQLCADGYCSTGAAAAELAPAREPEVEPTVDREGFYRLTRRHGYDYGRSFQVTDALWLLDDRTCAATLQIPERPGTEAERHVLHPTLLDGIFQMTIALDDFQRGSWDPSRGIEAESDDPEHWPLHLPVEIDRLKVFEAGHDALFVRYRSRRLGIDGTHEIFAADGRPAAIIEGARTRTVPRGDSPAQAADKPCHYVERFVAVDLPSSGAVAACGSWIVITDDRKSLRPFAEVLRERGAEVEFLARGASRELVSKLGVAVAENSITGVIFAGLSPAIPADDVPTRVEDNVQALIALASALESVDPEARIGLVVLTEGARAAGGDAVSCQGLAQAPLIGCMRTIMNESPKRHVRSLDVDRVTEPATRLWVDALSIDRRETELVIRGDRVLAPRLEAVATGQLLGRERTIRPAKGENFAVAMTQPGSLDRFLTVEAAMPKPAAGEILVEISAVGLNFRDVLAATGLLPGEPGGPDWWRILGFEFSGTVVGLGDRVKRFKVGDRVMGVGTDLFRRYARVSERGAATIPDGIDFAAAATIPTAFLTAEYALSRVARLARNESVLIHLASGGVGLAAIQVARRLGARILATAGSDEKRAYLRGIGIEHVMDSRSLDFADDVLSATGGRGVDVVLNALSGAAIDRGLQCLAPFGRFVEIGKRDLAEDKPMGLKRLLRNASFSVVDLAAIASEKPETLARQFKAVLRGFSREAYRPLVHTTFPASETASAMRHLGRAQHIGKVVMDYALPEVSVRADLSAPPAFRGDASYLVVGGTGGFGLATAHWLARHGAGRIVLASRRGRPDREAAERIGAIEAGGTAVETVALDVADAEAVRAVISRYVRSSMPLAGVVHAAAVIDDGLVGQLSQEQIRAVLRPKVTGGWNLLRALESADANLDFLLLFSSLSEAIGSIGQAHYAAANGFLNALSGYGKARLDTRAIAWGALGESGFVGRSESHQKFFSSSGIRPMADAEALAAVAPLARSDVASSVYAAIDWNRVASALSPEVPQRLQRLLTSRSSAGQSLDGGMAGLTRPQREERLQEAIRNELARVLDVEASAIDVSRPLIELGLDSLSSFELKNRMEARTNVTIPVTRFLRTPTVAGLADAFAALIDASGGVDPDGRTSHQSSALPAPTQVLSRQSEVLDLARRAATSDFVKHRVTLRRSAVLPGPVDRERLVSAVSEAVDRHSALRMRAVTVQGSRWRLETDGAPAVVEIVSELDLPKLPTDTGELWAFGLIEATHETRLVAAAHRAAADHVSLSVVVDAVVEAYRGCPSSDPPDDWTGYAAGRIHDDADPRVRRDRAYWRELLSCVEAPLRLPGRRYGLLPPGAGVGRRAIEVTDLEAATMLAAVKQAPHPEAVLLAAFCRSLAVEFGCDTVVVERHDPGRADSGPGGLVGPVSDAFPVVVERADRPLDRLIREVSAQLVRAADRVLDSASLVPLLERERRTAAGAVRQIGFSLLADRASEARVARGVSLADLADEPWNELRLNVEIGTSGTAAHLVFDPHVVAPAEVRRLAERFLAECRDAPPRHGLAVRDAATGEGLHPPSGHDGSDRDAPAAPVVLRPANGQILPLSMQQGFLLSALRNARTTDVFRRAWAFSRAYLIAPRLDLTRLREALGTLLARHEGLRARFREGSEGFRLVLEDRPQPNLRVEDLGDFDEHIVLRRVAALSSAALDPLNEPPYCVTVLRCGAAGDVLHCRAHHAIVDGWSMSLLVEDFLKVYFGASLPAAELSISEYLETYDRSHDPRILRRRSEYFAALFEDPPLVPRIGRQSRGMKPNLDMVEAGESGEILAKLSGTGCRAIAERIAAAGVSETALLIAAFAQTVAAVAGSGDVTVCLPAAMRVDRKLQTYVGWVSSLVPVRCRTSRFSDLDDLARDVLHQYQTSLAYLPADFTVRHGPLHDLLGGRGSYLTLFEIGMQAVDSLYRRRPTAALHRPAGAEEIPFGPALIKKIDPAAVQDATVYQLDVRSLDHEGARAYRCGFDRSDFAAAEAKAILCGILDRMGVPQAELDLRITAGASQPEER